MQEIHRPAQQLLVLRSCEIGGCFVLTTVQGQSQLRIQTTSDPYRDLNDR